jgi:hypothetical protein
MYRFLKRTIGVRWADRIIPYVYVAMFLAVLYCSFESQAEFSYLMI